MRWLRQNLIELLCLKDYKLLHLSKDLFSIRSILKISLLEAGPNYMNIMIIVCDSLINHIVHNQIYIHIIGRNHSIFFDYHHWAKGLNIWASRASWRWLGIYLDIKHEPTFVIRALIFFDMDHVVDDILRWWSR